MNYQILSITEDYITRFRRAVDKVAREKKYLALLEAPSMKKVRAHVLEQIQLNMPHFIAVVDKEVVGWCDISSFHRHAFAHSGVLGIGLLSPYRGCGIGSALMRAALDKARAIGLTRVELMVFATNKTAIALYEKIGFKVEGIKRHGVCIDGHYQDLVCMAILFDQ